MENSSVKIALLSPLSWEIQRWLVQSCSDSYDDMITPPFSLGYGTLKKDAFSLYSMDVKIHPDEYADEIDTKTNQTLWYDKSDISTNYNIWFPRAHQLPGKGIGWVLNPVMKGVTGLMLVYDVANKSTLQDLFIWFDKSLEYLERFDIPVIILGVIIDEEVVQKIKDDDISELIAKMEETKFTGEVKHLGVLMNVTKDITKDMKQVVYWLVERMLKLP